MRLTCVCVCVCVHEYNCLFFRDAIRDLSLNSLASVPTTGLSALNQLKLTGNVELRNGLMSKSLPKLR